MQFINCMRYGKGAALSGTELSRIDGPFKIANRVLFRDQHGTVLSSNILLTFLRTFDILSQPEHSSKHFRYCLEVFDEEELDAIDSIDPSCLYICSTKIAERLLRKSPMAFALVVSRDKTVPPWVHNNRTRVILVHSADRLFYIGSIVQNLFTSLIVWENNMDRIVSKPGTLTELLTEGSKALDSFVWMSDGGFNITARTESVEPPDAKLATILKRGCYSETDKRALAAELGMHTSGNEQGIIQNSSRRSLAQDDKIIWDDSHLVSDCTLLHYPILFENMTYFCLSMACTSKADEECARDFFAILAERVVTLCSTLWDRIIEVESPWYKVLTGLIDKESMKPEYVQAQLEQTALPDAAQMRLICIDIEASTDVETKHRVVKAARKLNRGHCYPFAYDNSLLVLCYTETKDLAHFSVDYAITELKETICEPYGVNAFVSRVFSDLDKIDLSYQETQITCNFSKYIEREQEIISGDGCHGVYLFEAAVPFYMAAKLYLDDTVVSESLKENPVRVLAEEDREMGTDIVGLLWTYLAMERNATAVSKSLHMHRNTVLYHIDKIKKRFDIDFDVYMHRTALLDCFRTLLLTNGYTTDIDPDVLFTIKRHDAQHPIQ